MCKSFFRTAVLASVLLTAATTIAQEQDRTALEKNLRSVRLKIETHNGQLQSFKRDQLRLEQTIEKLTKDAESLTQQERDARSTLAGVEKDVLVTQLAVNAAKERLGKRRELAEKRVVSIYKMQRRTAALDYVIVQASSGTDLLRRSRYLSLVAARDRQRLDELSYGVGELEREGAKLESLRQERAKRVADIERLERELSKRKLEKGTALTSLKQKVLEQERSLQKLEQSAQQLEGVLASLMGSVEPPTVKPEVKPELKPETRPEIEPVQPKPVDRPFSGKGLLALKGKMPLPVNGGVVQRFGKQRHEEFSEMMFVKGIEFSASIGAKVRPVASGKVILSQALPGLGNVVILDHGERYYSLYGRLASTLCQPGQVISSSDLVGITGEPDRKGRNFYFELRLKGKAIDPAEFFPTLPAYAQSEG